MEKKIQTTKTKNTENNTNNFPIPLTDRMSHLKSSHKRLLHRSLNRRFLRAVKSNDYKKCKKLIGHGANVNQKYDDSYSPLYYPLKNKKYNLCKLLLENGATLNIPFKDVLLNAAYINTSYEIFKLLVEHGADVNALTRNFETPLMQTMRADNPEAAECLLALGADPWRTDRASTRAYFYDWVMNERRDEVKKVIERYEDIWRIIDLIFTGPKEQWQDDWTDVDAITEMLDRYKNEQDNFKRIGNLIKGLMRIKQFREGVRKFNTAKELAHYKTDFSDEKFKEMTPELYWLSKLFDNFFNIVQNVKNCSPDKTYELFQAL